MGQGRMGVDCNDISKRDGLDLKNPIGDHEVVRQVSLLIDMVPVWRPGCSGLQCVSPG